MLLVIDSNVYIFGAGLINDTSCDRLIAAVIKNSGAFHVRIPRRIVEEVRRHLTPEDFNTFIRVINTLAAIDEDFVVPFELGAKYEQQGLKKADAFIAAYAEWVGADVLVSENRHFLTKHSNLPFKIMNAENFLKFMRAALQ